MFDLILNRRFVYLLHLMATPTIYHAYRSSFQGSALLL